MPAEQLLGIVRIVEEAEAQLSTTAAAETEAPGNEKSSEEMSEVSHPLYTTFYYLN